MSKQNKDEDMPFRKMPRKKHKSSEDLEIKKAGFEPCSFFWRYCTERYSLKFLPLFLFTFRIF